MCLCKSKFELSCFLINPDNETVKSSLFFPPITMTFLTWCKSLQTATVFLLKDGETKTNFGFDMSSACLSSPET
jgi:hypothetical protein